MLASLHIINSIPDSPHCCQILLTDFSNSKHNLYISFSNVCHSIMYDMCHCMTFYVQCYTLTHVIRNRMSYIQIFYYNKCRKMNLYR